MSIKTLLEKAMLRLGSRGSLRGTKAATYYPLNEEKATTFIAPTDGEVIVAGLVASGKTHGMLAVSNSVSMQITDRWYYCRAIGRFKKGDSVTCQQIGTDATEAAFYSTVGGGAKVLYYQLLNGGALCLRLSSWSMGRLKRGVSSLSRRETPWQLPQKLAAGNINTLLRQMDMLSRKLPTARSCICSRTPTTLCFGSQAQLVFERFSLLRRGPQSLFSSPRKVQATVPVLSGLSAGYNLTLGGAL